MTLRLLAIGGLGLMLSPAAVHLQPNGPARVVRVHDRGASRPSNGKRRDQWRTHGAELVPDFASLVGDGDFDGILICVGKNGDDLPIIRELVTLMRKQCHGRMPFICHLSTVSTGFVVAAQAFCRTHEVPYVNYPLTGGPVGANTATMLILASGDKALYDRLLPTLRLLGNPLYFNEAPSTGAAVKLIGHLMVFNGLMGICSAAALRAACYNEALGAEGQADFFDFLNQGAGGTRQWDVGLKEGLEKNSWEQGFMVHHAAIDAIYAIQLAWERKLAKTALLPLITTTLGLTFLLKKYPAQPIATHALARELTQKHAADLDEHTGQYLAFPDILCCIEQCIHSLPEKLQPLVKLAVDADSFKSG